MRRLNLTEEQLAMHLQVIAHAAHVQLECATQLLGGEPDALLEVIEMIVGVELLSAEMTDAEVKDTLDTLTSNITSFVAIMRKAAHADAHRTKMKMPAVNDN